MSDKSPPDQSKGKEAIVGVKADVKTLQQISSSGQAAKEKRNANQVGRIMGALGEAVRDEFEGGENQDQGKSDERKTQ